MGGLARCRLDARALDTSRFYDGQPPEHLGGEHAPCRLAVQVSTRTVDAARIAAAPASGRLRARTRHGARMDADGFADLHDVPQVAASRIVVNPVSVALRRT